MAKPRTEVPEDIATEVLVAAHRTCCVCRSARSGIQIHHIDDDPANHAVENLAVLCPSCHAQTQFSGGFVRHLDAALVRQYRDTWNQEVAQQNRRAAELQFGGLENAPEETGSSPRAHASISIRRAVIACAISGLLLGGVASATITDPEGGSPGYAKRLTAVLRDLDATRARAYRQLDSAHRARAQSRITTRLGGAFENAAGAVRDARPEAVDRAANLRIANRLEIVGDSYNSLGQAATNASGSQSQLDAARHRVRSGTWRLWKAQKALAGGRYRILRPRTEQSTR